MHKIGSIKNNKVNYHIDEQFFSNEDIPLKALDAKKTIQQKIDPDLLGLRNRQWNNSTSVPLNPLQEETHERKLIKIKLGLFDQPQPIQKDKKIELGTETRNDYTGWNVSTQMENKELRNNLNSQTMQARKNNKIKETTMLNGYINPVDGQKIQQEKLRMVKEIEKQYRDQIREEYLYANPAASQEKADAAVFRLTYENQLKQKQVIQDPGLTFKPQIKDTTQGKYIKAEHNGIYQITTKIEHDDEGNAIPVGVWSCCLAEEKDAPGCNKKLCDKARWNYASYNQD
ncbi:hypothetical protein PPERSA_04273 [Pseudocohnilembus persalinus]|uniref:Uncharacterized protein n=1 Tax=Pseudocohnilembus persalinus TaxID=266149 RepID=A0A0V0QP54_PSEPJ|nr:hypothetical protein PPERSA_04273 [Pseudocohnilembus persalinus]|eukprot:KRX03765.1 hypothetical protein PPERSA_04273 [Pseudocohnilembus persalinus]